MSGESSRRRLPRIGVAACFFSSLLLDACMVPVKELVSCTAVEARGEAGRGIEVGEGGESESWEADERRDDSCDGDRALPCR